MKLVREKLELQEFPPFPRKLPALNSYFEYVDRDFHYRKWMFNIKRNDMILEPG
jgi:hypothetical protein